MDIKDTSKDYDDMVGYIAEENINVGSLSDFLGEEKGEYKPEVKKKQIDNEFPESWQTLWVNITSFEEYEKFMTAIGSKPVAKIKELIYEKPGEKVGLDAFMGDD